MRCLFYTLLISLISTTMKAQANAWEYAFSQTEYEGSIVNDVLEVGDSILVAGAKNTCHTPGIWIFDDQGTLLSFKDLTPGLDKDFLYGYGKILELKYDSIAREILAIGLVAPADDVGAHTAYIYKLDHNIDITSSFDFTEIANHNDQSISFIDSGYAIQEGSQVYILNTDFELQKKLDFPVEPFEQYRAIYNQDTLFTHLISGHGIGNSITTYSATGDTIEHIETNPFDQFLVTEHFIITVDTKANIRKYRKTDLSLMDSIAHEGFDKVEIERVSPISIATFGYQKDNLSTIKILSEDFDIDESFETDLSNEDQLSISLCSDHYYLLGHFYPQLNIPYVRRKSIENTSAISRPDLIITNVELTAALDLDKPAYYSLTIENIGVGPITQFGYHTSKLGGLNCVQVNGYRDLDSFELLPGHDTTIVDSLYFVHSIPDSIDFYVVGPNHLLQEGGNSFTVTDITTSSTRIQSEKIMVYPNPSTDFLRFQVPDPVEQIMVSGIGGEILLAEKNDGDLIDISNLSPGIYFLQIRSGTKTYQSRFIKL